MQSLEDSLQPLPTTKPVDDHYIPTPKRELISRIAAEAEWNDEERAKFRQLCQIVQSVIRFECHQPYEELKAAYSSFDPDADLVDHQTYSDDHASDCLDRIHALLCQANYRRLSDLELDQAYGAASEWGVRLNVDLEAFDHLSVFARGQKTDRRVLRRWWRWFWPQEIEVSLYERLCVIYRLRDDAATDQDESHRIHLRLFKDIPQKDIDMLFPCIRVRMSLFDRGRVFLPSFSGMVFSAIKTFKAFLVYTLAAGLFAFVALLALIIGTVSYGIRSILGYLQIRKNYHHHVTQSLYYQSLGRNLSVLAQLHHEAEEQEFREAILAWFLLDRHRPAEGWTARQLDEAVEQFLESRMGVTVDFEVDDALRKATRLQLVEATDKEIYRNSNIDKALYRLDKTWDNYFPYH